MVLFFPGNHIQSPPFLSGGRFYGFFFLRDLGGEKKKRQPNFVSKPKLEKIHTFWGLIMTFFCHGFFFFTPNPEGKKRTVKLPPSFLFFWTTDTLVCDYREIKKPPPFVFFIPINDSHHRPSIRYIKNFGNKKMLILDGVFEIKKIFSERVISEKETQNGSSI